MAVLSREDFFSRLQSAVGNDVSEESLTLIEDMTDTYNDLEKRANGDGVDWEKRYNELDESWKQKYRHRFFSGNGQCNSNLEQENEDNKRANNISFNDLFSHR